MKKTEKKYKAIVIGGSAGSFQIVSKILSNLKSPFPIPIILSLHRLKHVRSGFLETLSLKSKVKISEPYDKDHIRPDNAYLAPANYHLLCEIGNTISLSASEPLNHSRPSIDLTFMSAAKLYRSNLLGIILSGANKDGALGAKTVKDGGGTIIIQDPETAEVKTMPDSVKKITKVDYIYDSESIIRFLNSIVKY